MLQMNNTKSNNQLKRNPLSEQTLIVTQFNCNSLKNKIGEFQVYLYNKKPDIICLCETLLKGNEPQFKGYSSYWKHREGERG